MVSSPGIFENCRPRIGDLGRMMFIAASVDHRSRAAVWTGRTVKIACLAPLVALR
jgi:hypothetical protein